VLEAGLAPEARSSVQTRTIAELKAVTTVTSLPTPRAGLGLVEQIAAKTSGAVNNLYAIGGVDEHGHALNTVEVYDFSTQTWSQATPMPTARGYLAVVAGTDGVDLLTTFTLSATDLDGGSTQVLGSTTQLIGIGLFGGTVQIPITTPLVLKNKVLVVTISDVLGLDLDLDFSRFYITITDVDGKP
jgi:hypothetical protein